MNTNGKNKSKKGDTLAGIEHVRDILNNTYVPDIKKMDIDESILHRLEEADTSELGSLEQELGIPSDSEFYNMINSDAEEENHQQARAVIRESIDDSEEEHEEEETSIDGSCAVHVNEDKMTAMIDLNPSEGHGKPLNWEMVSKELKAKGVLYGVNTDLLKKLVENVEKNKNPKKGVIVAQGILPEQGKDGTIEFRFSDDESVLLEDARNNKEDTEN